MIDITTVYMKGGKILHVEYGKLNRGNKSTNVIQVATPHPINTNTLIRFRLPNGVFTQSGVMKHDTNQTKKITQELYSLFEESEFAGEVLSGNEVGEHWSVWTYLIPSSVLSVVGRLFKDTADTLKGSFTFHFSDNTKLIGELFELSTYPTVQFETAEELADGESLLDQLEEYYQEKLEFLYENFLARDGTNEWEVDSSPLNMNNNDILNIDTLQSDKIDVNEFLSNVDFNNNNIENINLLTVASLVLDEKDLETWLNEKLDKNGDTMTGDLNMGNNDINNIKIINATSADIGTLTADDIVLDGVDMNTLLALRLLKDFSQYGLKTNLSNDDILAINDSQDGNNTKHTTFSNMISFIQSELSQFEFIKVADMEELEAIANPKPNAIYLVPLDEPEQGNLKEEWIWLPQSEQWELIGTTEIDLSDYITESEIEALLLGNIGNREYTEQNVVTNDETITLSVDALDIEVGRLETDKVDKVEGKELSDNNYTDDDVNQSTWSKNIMSSGRLYGGVITEGDVAAATENATVSVSAGGGVVKDSISGIEEEPTAIDDGQGSTGQKVTWLQQDVELVPNAYNYIYYDPISETMKTTVTFDDINFTSEFTVGRIYYTRTGTAGAYNHDLAIRLCGTNLWNFDRRVQYFGEKVFPVIRAEGLIPTGLANRYIEVSEGLLIAELVNPFRVAGIDTSATDDFTSWYGSTSEGYTKIENETQIDNGNYWNGTELTALGTNSYTAHWLYAVHDDTYHMVYGHTSGNLSTAQNAQVPAEIPPLLQAYGTLIAKLIVRQNENDFIDVQTPIETAFQTESVSLHNDLSGRSESDAHPISSITGLAEALEQALQINIETVGYDSINEQPDVAEPDPDTLYIVDVEGTPTFFVWNSELEAWGDPVPINIDLTDYLIAENLGTFTNPPDLWEHIANEQIPTGYYRFQIGDSKLFSILYNDEENNIFNINIIDAEFVTFFKVDYNDLNNIQEIERKRSLYDDFNLYSEKSGTLHENDLFAINDGDDFDDPKKIKLSTLVAHLDIPTEASDIDAVHDDIGGTKLWRGTQEEYDGITTKDPNTIYMVTGDLAEYIEEIYVGTNTEPLDITNGAVTIPLATTSIDGVMSSSDKTKLDGIDDNANDYTHPTETEATITAQDGRVISAITVNNKGHVTSVDEKTLTENDIPTLSQSKITNLETDLDNKTPLRERKIISDNYTIIDTDIDKLLLYSNASEDITITVPADGTLAVDIGVEIEIVRLLDGEVMVGGAAGVQVNGLPNPQTVALGNKNKVVRLKKVGSDTWELYDAMTTIPTDVNDLTDNEDKLGDKNVQSDWNQTVDTEDDYIKNKPTVVEANTAITADTKTKITYDTKGLVTAGADLASTDIPDLDASKTTSGTFDEARIPTKAQPAQSQTTCPTSHNTAGGHILVIREAGQECETKYDGYIYYELDGEE